MHSECITYGILSGRWICGLGCLLYHQWANICHSFTFTYIIGRYLLHSFYFQGNCIYLTFSKKLFIPFHHHPSLTFFFFRRELLFIIFTPYKLLRLIYINFDMTLFRFLILSNIRRIPNSHSMKKTVFTQTLKL